MDYKKYGNSGLKILIVHGWLHSNKRYEKLAIDLSKNYEVMTVCLPGFGHTKCEHKENIINEYVLQLQQLLTNNKFDLIIGHSLGCNVILKMLHKNTYIKSKVLLIAPSYHQITLFKRHRILKMLTYCFFYFSIKMPLLLVKPLISFSLRLGVDDPKYNDDISISDFRAADPRVATNVIFELGYDDWRITKPLKNKFTIVKSKKDKIVLEKNVHLLCSDLNNCELITFENCGHIPITENYDEMLQVIYNLIKQ